MQFKEHEGIAAIDDISAYLSEIRGAVRVLAARWRVEFAADDVAELRRILDAVDAIHQEHLTVRREFSARVKVDQNRR